MATEGANEVRVFDLFVEAADKAAAGKMRGCDFVERADFLLAGGWDMQTLIGLRSQCCRGLFHPEN